MSETEFRTRLRLARAMRGAPEKNAPGGSSDAPTPRSCWIPLSERMPSAADGMSGSLYWDDNANVIWMTSPGGIYLDRWNDAPSGSVAWCRIPEYVPPVLPPVLSAEDKSRSDFEAWADVMELTTERHASGEYVSEAVCCAWLAWQAARKGGAAQ